MGLFELYRIYRYWGNSRRVAFRRAWRRWRGVAPLARGGAVVDILLAVYFGFALGLLTGCLAGANGDD